MKIFVLLTLCFLITLAAHGRELYSEEFVKLPIAKDLFFCQLKNIRNDGKKISLKPNALFRFSDEDGFYWEHFLTGRIWQKKLIIWDNGKVQNFSCNDTAAFHNEIPSKGVTYRHIKEAVGSYLEININ